jgi:hypothetical protein
MRLKEEQSTNLKGSRSIACDYESDSESIDNGNTSKDV